MIHWQSNSFVFNANLQDTGKPASPAVMTTARATIANSGDNPFDPKDTQFPGPANANPLQLTQIYSQMLAQLPPDAQAEI